MSNLTSEQKIDYISFAVDDLLAQAQNGILCFDVVFDEANYFDETHFEGKAFTTDGMNFYGYTKNEKANSPFGGSFGNVGNRLFAGTYIYDKGMTVMVIPFEESLFEIDDLTLNVTNRPNNEYMHGKSVLGLTRAKVDLIENIDEAGVTEIFKGFTELLAELTGRYPDIACDLIQKSQNQQEDKEMVEKLHERLKKYPVPRCFAEDGTASNGPAK